MLVGVEAFGNFDLAAAAIWAFWLFLALLIYIVQRSNMHEGYPLETDGGDISPNQGPIAPPAPKTYILPNGRGTVTVPTLEREKREVALKRSSLAEGSPFVPTGDPMADGVGPASWAPRKDEPELTGRGEPKIRPLSVMTEFKVSAGRDPRGLTVQAGDGAAVGNIVDLWVDEPECLVRYLEVELFADFGGGRRLIPMPLAVIKPDRVTVRSIYGKQFAGVPTTKAADVVTKLEEDKISGYFAGGVLYADPQRQMPIFDTHN
jgi:photosynthetic reaction center H subunit